MPPSSKIVFLLKKNSLKLFQERQTFLVGFPLTSLTNEIQASLFGKRCVFVNSIFSQQVANCSARSFCYNNCWRLCLPRMTAKMGSHGLLLSQPATAIVTLLRLTAFNRKKTWFLFQHASGKQKWRQWQNRFGSSPVGKMQKLTGLLALKVEHDDIPGFTAKMAHFTLER